MTTHAQAARFQRTQIPCQALAVAHQGVDIAVNEADGIVQLVSHPGGDLSEGGHFFRLYQLGLSLGQMLQGGIKFRLLLLDLHASFVLSKINKRTQQSATHRPDTAIRGE